MKGFTKIALGALMLAGATALTAAPASAQVSFGLSVGGPGYYGPRVTYNYCDRYSRWYDPYRCGGYYSRSYYAPSYYGSYGRPYYGPSFYVRGGNYRGGYHGGGYHGPRRHR